MAEKDASEKILEAYNDVFADIVNVLLFSGKEVLKEDELVEQDKRTAYKIDDRIREIERDVAKRWLKQNIRIACIGFENQTSIDADMPLRCLAYDGAEYRSQLNLKERYPVVTLVLYFGYEKRWDKPLSLLERLTVPEEFKPYVQDYRLNLFEIAYLTDEQVNMFKSDFRIVADYFVQMRKNHDYKPEPQKMKHVQEVLQLLSVMTKDRRFEESYTNEPEGGFDNMCEVLDRLINKGIAEGRAEGRAAGIAEGEAKGRAEGEAKGRAEGKAKGENLVSSLMEKLLSVGRTEDALKASKDPEYRHKLYLEFGLE